MKITDKNRIQYLGKWSFYWHDVTILFDSNVRLFFIKRNLSDRRYSGETIEEAIDNAIKGMERVEK